MPNTKPNLTFQPATPAPGRSAPDAETRHPPSLPAGLYLVATPIGHAGDITLRALETLKGAQLIACEDTRVSGSLLRRYGVATPLISYHEHNAAAIRPKLIQRIQNGEAVALISDAGSPLISDPGYKLVRDVIAHDLLVTAIPGPTALIAALQLSGLPSDAFYFGGFLPRSRAARAAALHPLKALPASLLFYEAPHRLVECLSDLADAFPNREAAIARELTKRFEEVRRGPIDALRKHYEEAGPPKGEVVIVLGPPQEKDGRDEAANLAALTTLLRTALEQHSLRDAVAAIAAATGRPKKEIYALALHMQKEGS